MSHRWHVLWGKAIFITALATCALGFQDMQSSDLSVDVDDMAYQPFSVWANYACAAVLMLLVFGVAVLAVSDMMQAVEPLHSKSVSYASHAHIVASPSSSSAELSAITTSTAVEIE